MTLLDKWYGKVDAALMKQIGSFFIRIGLWYEAVIYRIIAPDSRPVLRTLIFVIGSTKTGLL